MLTREYLKDCVKYDCESGVLYWIPRPQSHFGTKHSYYAWLKKHSGKPVGSIQVNRLGQKHLRTKVCGKSYLVHRLIWLLVYGEWPDEIDHIDGNTLNNRLDNLRNVSRTVNCKNKPLQKSNTSGVVGVNYNTLQRKWVSRISHEGVRYNLGVFDQFDLAVKARKEAEKKYGYHENHGR